MQRFVADNSVIIAWGLGEDCAYASAVLDQVPHCQVLVPSVWPLELTNALVVAERRRRISAAELVQLRDLLLSLGIVIVQDDPRRIFSDVLSLAREEGLSSYDASYLDLAIRENASLATLDDRLASAARRRGVQRFLEP